MQLLLLLRRVLGELGWPIVCGLLTAAVFILLPAQFEGLHTDTVSAVAAVERVPVQGSRVASYAAAVRKAAPSVVNIYTQKRLPNTNHPLAQDPFFKRFFENSDLPQQQRMALSLGSGVIVNDRGFILTNHHVIKDATEVLALLYDGREARAKIIGIDPETDLAVLKIDLDELKPISIAPGLAPEVGDIVLAIGNPLGVGQSVSQGIISATGRRGVSLNTYENFLQTDAAINPGNSGGALIDVYGNLLGINSATLREVAVVGANAIVGIGFAIPASMAVNVLEDITRHGRVIRGWLGIETELLPLIDETDVVLNSLSALVVTAVPIYGPAYNSGLKQGDIITHINGFMVSDDGDSEMTLIAGLSPGDPIELRIIRQNNHMTIKAVAGVRPLQES